MSQLLVDDRAVLHPAAPCSAGYAAERAADDRVEVTHQMGTDYP
jgi:hypothetical protein